MNRNQIDLCDWLGTASVSEFKSEAQIREYFAEENLRKMFGAEADLEQREPAMQQCLHDWAVEHIEHSSDAREFFVGQNISKLGGVTVAEYYPVIDREGSIVGWYGADEGNDEYVLCDFSDGKLCRIGSGSDAVISREDLTSEERIGI